MRVRSPLPGWLAAASVARALFVLSLLRGDPSFRLYLGWSERLAPSHSLTRVRAAPLCSGEKKEKKRKAASQKPKARIVALLELISVDDSRSRGRDILFHRQRGETKKKSESPELVSRGERSKVGRHVGSLALPRRLRFLGRL